VASTLLQTTDWQSILISKILSSTKILLMMILLGGWGYSTKKLYYKLHRFREYPRITYSLKKRDKSRNIRLLLSKNGITSQFKYLSTNTSLLK
jgi:hypothetical protein